MSDEPGSAREQLLYEVSAHWDAAPRGGAPERRPPDRRGRTARRAAAQVHADAGARDRERAVARWLRERSAAQPGRPGARPFPGPAEVERPAAAAAPAASSCRSQRPSRRRALAIAAMLVGAVALGGLARRASEPTHRSSERATAAAEPSHAELQQLAADRADAAGRAGSSVQQRTPVAPTSLASTSVASTAGNPEMSSVAAASAPSGSARRLRASRPAANPAGSNVNRAPLPRATAALARLPAPSRSADVRPLRSGREAARFAPAATVASEAVASAAAPLEAAVAVASETEATPRGRDSSPSSGIATAPDMAVPWSSAPATHGAQRAWSIPWVAATGVEPTELPPDPSAGDAPSLADLSPITVGAVSPELLGRLQAAGANDFGGVVGPLDGNPFDRCATPGAVGAAIEPSGPGAAATLDPHCRGRDY